MSNGISRRKFVKKMAIGGVSTAMLMASISENVIAAETGKNQPFVWLNGHSGNLHRSNQWAVPQFSEFLSKYFKIISTDSNDTDNLPKQINNRQKPYLILDGYFPDDQEDWIFMQLRYLIKNSKVVILVGNEASYGQNAPEGFLNIENTLLKNSKTPIIRLPGQSVQLKSLLGVLNYLVLYNKMPKLDELRRPLMIYSDNICNRCEYRSDFEAGNFVSYFGEKKGCLYHLGCKGSVTKNNCSTEKFNGTGQWCVGVGSPCTGCSEPGYPNHSGIGLYGSLSGGVAGVNSSLIRNSGKIAQGALAVTVTGIGLHALSKRNEDPIDIRASFNDIEEDNV